MSSGDSWVKPPPLPNLADAQSVVGGSVIPQDDAIQQHYVRLQKTLFHSVDQELDDMHLKMKEAIDNLKQTEDDKTAIGVALYQANSKIGRMNHQLQTVRQKFEKAEDYCLMADQEKVVMSRQIENATRELREKQTDLEQTGRYLEESNVKVNQLTDVNAAFTSDIKIQRRIQSKYKIELEISETKRKQSESDLEEEKKRSDELTRRVKDLMLLNEEQKSETIIAQKAVEKMNREISQMNVAKKTMEKQWEESISAMTKRDQTLQAVQNIKEDVQNQLTEHQINLRSIRAQRDQAESRLKDKENECQDMSGSMTILKSRLSDAEKELSHLKNELSQASVTQSVYRQDLESLKRNTEIKTAELETKSVTISGLKSKLEDMKERFEGSVAEKSTLEQAIRTEELERGKKEAAIVAREKSSEFRNVAVLNQHAAMKLQFKSHADEMNDVVRDRNALKAQLVETTFHYNKLYDESKYLIHSLERKEHDLNYLQDKLARTDHDNEGSFHMELRRMQNEVREAIKEKDRVQTMWVDERENALRLKDVVKQMELQKSFLDTQYRITEAVKQKTINEIQDSEDRANEHKMETSRLSIQLKKMQPIIDELRERNSILESQLQESRAIVQESKLDNRFCAQMLKTEIRGLYQEKKETRKQAMTKEKSSLLLERKYIIAKEMLEKLQEEKVKLLKANFDLKRRSDTLEVKFNELKTQSKSSVRGRSSTTHQPGSSTPRTTVSHSWESALMSDTNRAPSEPLPSLVTGGSKSHTNSATDKSHHEELPDFESWRLKLESLGHERGYLMNENRILKLRIDELSSRILSMERKLEESTASLEKLSQDMTLKKGELSEAEKKYQRAEKIAAHLEKQFKDARPNTKIDYYLLSESEPSTQLLAALLAQPPPSKIDRAPQTVLPVLQKRVSRRISAMPLGNMGNMKNATTVGQMS